MGRQLLLRGGSVLVGGSFSTRDVLIADDHIEAVSPAIAPGEGYDIVDLAGSILIPGLVNAHTHSNANLSRGATGRRTLEQLLFAGPAVYGKRSPEEHYLSAAIGAAEMVRFGTTATFDMVLMFPADIAAIEAVVQAYVDVGIRATVAPLVWNRSLLDAFPLSSALMGIVGDESVYSPSAMELASLEAFITRTRAIGRGRVTPALAPLIPMLCSDEYLIMCSRLARAMGVMVQIHVAESTVQQEWAKRLWGCGVVEHLYRLDVLGPEVVAAHAIHISEEELVMLIETGTKIVHLPTSNLRLGNGIAAVANYAERGATVGLGTDGATTSDGLGMFEAMKFAALVSTVQFPYQPEKWLGSREVFTMATCGSAQALGLAQPGNGLREGGSADIAVIGTSASSVSPTRDLLNSLVFAENGCGVTEVIIGGDLVVSNGKAVRVREDHLREQAVEATGRIAGRADFSAPRVASQLDSAVLRACLELL